MAGVEYRTLGLFERTETQLSLLFDIYLLF